MSAILVVDDEVDVQYLFRLTFERIGHEVIIVGSAEDGLLLLKQELPDLLVVDIRLPGLDGWGLLEVLRERKLLPGLPVIVVSAHATKGTPARALAMGCRAYVTKPFETGALVAAVESALAAG